MSIAVTGATKDRSYDGDYMMVGKEAEQIVMEFLQKRPEVLGVLDFRDLKAVQEADVDCAIKTRDGRVTLAEIKSDKHLGISNNVLFEVLRINHTAHTDHSLTLGWSGRTPATYLLYYASSVNKIYRIKTADLRLAFQKYTREARKNTRISFVETDSIKSTINILIPWNYCKDFFTVYSLTSD